jgi:Protein of unknown function (DUF1552)
MFITKKHLPRRTFLRGMGVTLALPLLDAMLPAQTLLKKTAAAGAPRMGFVYVPHGAIMNEWTPAAEGTAFEFSRVLKPLEPFRDRLNIVSGLGNRAADSTAVHSLSPTTWLSGVRPKPTQGVDAYAGITADQIAAQHIGQDTPLPSIELATEDHSALLGACDRDYGCIYMNTLSWRTHTTPMPMEIDPRKAFERMFGQGGTAAERALRTQQDRSILDEITAEAGALKLKVGKRDQATLSDYLDSVREIERRIERANFDSSSSLELPVEPVGIPYNFEEHVNIMYDMLVLAYQANITRVFTYMVAREESNKTYPQVGVHDGHHATSHHQNLPEKIEKLVKIQTYHAGLFARFLGKLKDTPDGDGNLLDHSIILYGSNMSNSNLHNHFPLPNLVAGGACGKLAGGRHLRYEDHTPIANLLLTLLEKGGMPMENIGDSTGELINI